MTRPNQSTRRMGVYQALTPQFKLLADEYGTEDVIRTLRKVGGELQDVMIALERQRQARQFGSKYYYQMIRKEKA